MYINKKLLGVIIFLVISFSIYMYVKANVNTVSKYEKTHVFDLAGGFRIIVIDTNKATRVYTRIIPANARIFDYTIPENKKCKGYLKEN